MRHQDALLRDIADISTSTAEGRLLAANDRRHLFTFRNQRCAPPTARLSRPGEMLALFGRPELLRQVAKPEFADLARAMGRAARQKAQLEGIVRRAQHLLSRRPDRPFADFNDEIFIHCRRCRMPWGGISPRSSFAPALERWPHTPLNPNRLAVER